MFSKWVMVLRSSIEHFADDDCFQLAGNMAFMTLLSVFPFFIFLTAIAGFVGDQRAMTEIIQNTHTLMPPDVSNAIIPILTDVISNQQGGLLTLGIVVALWTASSGVQALRLGLNRAYDAVEHRPFWMTRIISMCFVVVGAVFLVTVSMLIVLGPVALKILAKYVVLPSGLSFTINIVRYISAFGILAIMMLVIHRILPARHMPGIRMWPGILLTIVMWLSTASLFSLYLSHFNSYAVTYGSLGGIMIALIFFYLTGLIFLFGGQFNAALWRVKNDATPQSQN